MRARPETKRENRQLTTCSSVKPRVMTSQSSVNLPKTGLKTAQNSAKHYKKQVMSAVFALITSTRYL